MASFNACTTDQELVDLKSADDGGRSGVQCLEGCGKMVVGNLILEANGEGGPKTWEAKRRPRSVIENNEVRKEIWGQNSGGLDPRRVKAAQNLQLLS